MGLIRVEGLIRWQRLAREVRSQFGWKSFIDFEIIDEQSAKVVLQRSYWIELWKPKNIFVDNTLVHISQFKEKEYPNSKDSIANKTVPHDNIIPIHAMIKLGKLFKI